MKRIYGSILSVTLLLSFAPAIFADVKIRQRVSMGGQTFETTKMIKGARQRTEQKSGAGGAMDFMSQVATIEQCDLRRTVRLNDSKKLYFIDPFAEESTTQTPTPTRPTNQQTKRGGTITMTYVVTDTGERKTLFGLQARHLKILQETESSADSCSGAFRSKMEIDGWYVDFSAEFNCPVDIPQTPYQGTKPDCKDRIIFKGNSAAKTGFLLSGTMTMYDQNGSVQMTQTTETLELSRAALAASLFDVPADYKLVSSQQDLYSMPSMDDLMRQQQQLPDKEKNDPSLPSSPFAKSVGLNITYGADAKVNQTEISQYLQSKLRENNLNARIGAGGGNLDYVLNVEIKKVKETKAGKIGGIFGKVTGVESKGQTEIELVMTLARPNSNSPVTQSRITQKYDGTVSEALKAAIDDGLDKILSEIED